MKILMCSPFELDPRLGAPKMLMELSAALVDEGADCTLIGPEHLQDEEERPLAERLYAYLIQHAGAYDVVDFDVRDLALRRSRFPAHVLFVARAQLLHHHVVESPLPVILGPRTALHLMKHKWVLRKKRALVQGMNATFREADLASVLNEHARATLIRHGVAPNRIVVLPNGMAEHRLKQFETVSMLPPDTPRVGFVGMFGPRKGSTDLAVVFRHLAQSVPEVQFLLLGTWGMFKTEEEVLRHFSPGIRSRIEVVQRYTPEDLPGYLATCSVGVFPSYAEGFPFGILEMLAASVPVIAYDAPGAPEMLPQRYLTALKDPRSMAEKVRALLENPEELQAARFWARDRAGAFRWPDIAKRTLMYYSEALQTKRRVSV